MSLTIGGNSIARVYCGTENIASCFHGSHLVWGKGFDTIEIAGSEVSCLAPGGYYAVTLVGGGGTVAKAGITYPYYYGASPASGAAFRGIIHTPGERTIVVSAGTTDADSFITVGGVEVLRVGKGGNATHHQTAGVGGIVTIEEESMIYQTILSQSGNNGISGASATGYPAKAGGEAVITDEEIFGCGYGKGGDKPAGNTSETTGAISGYVRIEYRGIFAP